MSKNVLVVAAHPDDEILGCGATICKHTKQGDVVHIIIMAEGLTSRDDKRDVNIHKNDLVYCDPPYLITTATYNEKEGWTEQDEIDLLTILDNLSERGIKFALSNVLQHEGKQNILLQEWIGQHNYVVHNLFMDYHYSNYQKKSKKAESQEVLITNY